MLKKLLLVLFIPGSIIVSVFFLIPVFFDANKHVKPYVEKAISQYLDVEPHLGSFSVTIWGKIAVHVAGVDLVDKQTNKSIFKVQDAEFSVPLAPLLTKSIDVTFVAKSPDIKAISARDGKINFVRLMKTQASTESTDTSAPAAAAPLAFLKD